jgi:hypothetical protein
MKHQHNTGIALKLSIVLSRTSGALKSGLVVSRWCLEVLSGLFNYDLTIVGDFRQCLPVIQMASRAQFVASTVSNAIFWKDVVHLKLHINMCLLSQAGQMDPDHLQHAQSYANWLLDIGNREVDSKSLNEITLPDGKIPYFAPDTN